MAEVVRILECECGFTVEGTEDEIVEAADRHGRQVHGVELSREQILAMSRPAQ